MEIELELALMLGHQRAKRDFQRHVALELRGQLLDCRDLGETELAGILQGTTRRRRSDETPLLQVAEMVLGDAWIEMSNVFDAD